MNKMLLEKEKYYSYQELTDLGLKITTNYRPLSMFISKNELDATVYFFETKLNEDINHITHKKPFKYMSSTNLNK
jgi:CRISPR/Cas system CMR-associated protein Cmr5 small subunit